MKSAPPQVLCWSAVSVCSRMQATMRQQISVVQVFIGHHGSRWTLCWNTKWTSHAVSISKRGITEKKALNDTLVKTDIFVVFDNLWIKVNLLIAVDLAFLSWLDLVCNNLALLCCLQCLNRNRAFSFFQQNVWLHEVFNRHLLDLASLSLSFSPLSLSEGI